MYQSVKNRYRIQIVRRREFDETAVLDAAAKQVQTTGYAGTSLDNLSAATSLGRGSLYGAFDDKHTLYMSALKQYSATSIANT